MNATSLQRDDVYWDDEIGEKVEAAEQRAAALEEELGRLRRKLAGEA